MKTLQDIFSQLQSAGISNEKLKDPLLKKLEGIIESKENIFFFTKSFYNGVNGLIFLTSKGVLFAGEKTGKKIFIQRIEGEHVEGVRFDNQMFNNSTLTVVARNGEFLFESINKEDGQEFMSKYKRYHGLFFGKKTRTEGTVASKKEPSNLATGVILAISVLLLGIFVYSLTLIEPQKKSSSNGERTIFLKEGNGNLNLGDTGKVVIGDGNGNSQINVGPNFDLAKPKKQITEILKAKKPEEKKAEVNKLNDFIKKMGKMVVEGFAELTSDGRIMLKFTGDDGVESSIEIQPKDSKINLKDLIEEKSLFNKNLSDRFSCEGEAKLNDEVLILTGCSIR